MAVSPRIQRSLATATLVGVGLFVGLVLVLHVLEPDVAGLQHTMSEFALGKYGFLMMLAFVGAGLGSLALAAILIQGSLAGRARVSGILVGLWGIGLLVSAFVPTDPYGTTDATATAAGGIHNGVGGLSFLFCGVGLVTLGIVARKWTLAGWPRRAAALLASGVVGLASVVMLFLPFDIPEGALQRVMVSSFVVGLLLAASWLRADAGATP